MKKIYLIIILIILVLTLIGVCTFNLNNNSKNNNVENSLATSDDTSQVNTNGENAGIYVGITDDGKENYLFVSTKINKQDSQEEQINSLIDKIGNSIGYKIDINSIEKNSNEIKIDFSKTSAPFELSESFDINSSPSYFITNDKIIAKTIFDSINKTLKSYFGANTNIYFSADSENINIENEVISINIDANTPY